MPQPTVGRALGAGMRAVAGEAWLAVLGMLVLLGRGLLALPASAFWGAVSAMVLAGAVRRGGGPGELVRSLAGVWASPRARSIAVGLWLAGLLLWWALRVAWIAGALPILAARMSGQPTRPAFAEGAAWRFARVLPSAAVALLLDLLAYAMVLAAILGAAAVGASSSRAGAPAAFAFVTAAALVAVLFLGAALHVLGDAAVARAAMAGDGPGAALGGAVRTLLRRPAALVAGLLAVAVATSVATGSVQLSVGAVPGVLRAGARGLFLVPEVLLATLGALVAAGAELWLLAVVGALALGGQPRRAERPSSLRSESFGMRPPSQ